jgi:hypothetical protein
MNAIARFIIGYLLPSSTVARSETTSDPSNLAVLESTLIAHRQHSPYQTGFLNLETSEVLYHLLIDE